MRRQVSTPTEELQLLLSATSPASRQRTVDTSADPAGLAAALFDHVTTLAASDPRSSEHASRLYKHFNRNSAAVVYAARARATGLRSQGKWIAAAELLNERADVVSDTADKWILRTGVVDSLARAGMTLEAIALGERGYQELQSIGRNDLARRIALNLGNAYLWSDRYADAIRCYALAHENSGPKDEALRAYAYLGQSSANLYGGDVKEAQTLALLARDLFTKMGADYYAIICGENLARAQMLLGNPEQAVRTLRDMNRLIDREDAETGRVNEFLGDALFSLNLFTESAASYRKALSMPQSQTTPLQRGNCALGLGKCYSELGEYRLSLIWLNKAERMFAKAANEPWRAAAFADIAKTLRRSGRPAKAIEKIDIAIQKLKETDSYASLAVALIERHLIMMATGDSDLRSLVEAIEIIERFGVHSLRWETEWRVAQQCPHKEEQLQSLLGICGNLIAGARAIETLPARIAYFHDKTELFRETIDLLLDSGRNDHVQSAVNLIGAIRGSTLIVQRNEEVDDRFLEVSELRQEISVLTGAYKRGLPTPRAKWETAQKRLRELLESEPLIPGTVASPSPKCVIYHVREARVAALFGSVTSELSLSESSIRSEARASAMRIGSFETGRPVAADVIESHAIALASELGLSGIEARGLISPDADMWRLPWGLIGGAAGFEPLLAISPAVPDAVLRSKLPANPSAMVFAYDGKDLPLAKLELRQFLNRFPSSVVIRNAAQLESAMKRSRADILHIIGHGQFNRENPMFSTVETAGTSVTAAEIATSGIRARFVSLSACQLGGLGGSRVEPEGMVRAFLSARSEFVLASAWNVGDKQAAQFSARFFGSLAGNRPDEALKDARMYLRTKEPHPYHWAPYQLYVGPKHWS